METKWYSDFWNLLTQPFKGGIDQVVQYGTLKKRFLRNGTLMGYSLYLDRTVWSLVVPIASEE